MREVHQLASSHKTSAGSQSPVSQELLQLHPILAHLNVLNKEAAVQVDQRAVGLGKEQ